MGITRLQGKYTAAAKARPDAKLLYSALRFIGAEKLKSIFLFPSKSRVVGILGVLIFGVFDI